MVCFSLGHKHSAFSSGGTVPVKPVPVKPVPVKPVPVKPVPVPVKTKADHQKE